MNIDLRIFGKFLIMLGVIGFAAAVIISFTPYSGMDHGALPAASFLIIMLGLAFAFPSLLKDAAGGGLSTMRIVVFAVVLLFCTIYLKIGWSVSKYEDFTIDQRWIYILGLAFGSKAFQRFGENEDKEDKEEAKIKVTQTTEKEITAKTGSGTSTGKDTSQDISK